MLVLFSVASLAQSNRDSLQQVLVDHLEKEGYSNDTTIVKTYYRIARSYKSSKDSANFHYDLAITFCNDVLDSKQYNKVQRDYFRFIKGLSLSRKGKNYYYDSHYDIAEKIGIEAVKTLKKLELSSRQDIRPHSRYSYSTI